MLSFVLRYDPASSPLVQPNTQQQLITAVRQAAVMVGAYEEPQVSLQQVARRRSLASADAGLQVTAVFVPGDEQPAQALGNILVASPQQFLSTDTFGSYTVTEPFYNYQPIPFPSPSPPPNAAPNPFNDPCFFLGMVLVNGSCVQPSQVSPPPPRPPLPPPPPPAPPGTGESVPSQGAQPPPPPGENPCGDPALFNESDCLLWGGTWNVSWAPLCCANIRMPPPRPRPPPTPSPPRPPQSEPPALPLAWRKASTRTECMLMPWRCLPWAEANRVSTCFAPPCLPHPQARPLPAPHLLGPLSSECHNVEDK